MDHWDRRDLSQALLIAQQKLNSLREFCREQTPLANPKRQSDGRTQNIPCPRPDQPERSLPDHLGWGSVPLTQALRKAASSKASDQAGPQRSQATSGIRFCDDSKDLTAGSQKGAGLEIRSDLSGDRSHIKLYPDLALGMLGQKIVSAGRIWLLLQHIDRAGRGWLDVATAREQLTRKNTPLYLCGRRQLRKLLARGEGLFWTRNRDRIWLRSPAKVAAALGITHLSGRPVALPVSTLLEGIGTVRAHFYASFHSGRAKKQSKPLGTLSNTSQTSPLSRTTLQAVSHVKPRTQRHYEKRARVQRQPNFVISKQSTKEAIQEQAWQHGRAWFRFIDHTGKLGEKGAVYSAWQLPNSYVGPHEQQPIGCQKRINQELAVLSMKGMTGNGKGLFREEIDYPIENVRLFHISGSAAAVSYNRHPARDVYWPGRLRRRGQYEMWHYLPGQGSR